MSHPKSAENRRGQEPKGEAQARGARGGGGGERAHRPPSLHPCGPDKAEEADAHGQEHGSDGHHRDGLRDGRRGRGRQAQHPRARLRRQRGWQRRAGHVRRANRTRHRLPHQGVRRAAPGPEGGAAVQGDPTQDGGHTERTHPRGTRAQERPEGAAPRPPEAADSRHRAVPTADASAASQRARAGHRDRARSGEQVAERALRAAPRAGDPGRRAQLRGRRESGAAPLPEEPAELGEGVCGGAAGWRQGRRGWERKGIRRGWVQGCVKERR